VIDNVVAVHSGSPWHPQHMKQIFLTSHLKLPA
jgi:hypothetical protein